MKKLLTFLAFLLPLCLMAQAPPVLRQSLTTNTASNPSVSGHVPIWNGSSWIPGVPFAETWWTNFTVTDFEGGTVYGIADTNAISSSAKLAVNFLTNAMGAASSLIVLGVQGSGGDPDLRQIAAAILAIGDDALNFSTLSNAIKVSAIASETLEGSILVNVEEVFGMARALRNAQITNSSRIVAIGRAAIEAADVTSSVDLFAMGIQALDEASVTNSTRIYAVGFNALGFGAIGPIIRNSTQITAIGANVMANSIADTSSDILCIGSAAGRLIKLTNCVGLNLIGKDTGTNLIMTAKTNVVLIGNVGAITPANEEMWFGNTNSRYLLPGLATSGGITNNGTYQHTVGAFTGALFVSSNANGVAYWSTNVNNIGVTNLSVYNNVIFNGSIVSNFNQDLNWTNDTVVLRTVITNPVPPLRAGMAVGGASGSSGIPMSDFWLATNVGMGSVGFGSNVLSRAKWGSVLGGELNEIGTNARASVIVGGHRNWIDTNAHTSFIGGGGLNRMRPAAGTDTGPFASVICGGTNNIIQYGSSGQGGAFIGAGGDNTVHSNHTAIVAGFGNLTRGEFSFIGAGLNNTLANGFQGVGRASFIGAGEECGIAQGTHSVLGGGYRQGIGGTGTSGHYSFIGGGASNNIAPTGTGDALYSTIGGGADNNINGGSTRWAFIGGGNLNGASETNAVIGGGQNNLIGGAGGAGPHAMILGGINNNLNGHVKCDFIIGSSNLVTTNFVGILGWGATNTTLPFSITIAPQGEATKTIFTSSNLTVRTSFATVPDTVVTLAADNQVVDATLRTHIRLASDSAVAGDRTFLLTGTNVVSGAHAILEWTGTNAGELVDDSANSGAGNIRLSATWTPTQYDTLSLIFNGTDWVETARATN